MVVPIGLEVGRLADLPTTRVYGTVRATGRGLLLGTHVSMTNVFNRRISVVADVRRSREYSVLIEAPGTYAVTAIAQGCQRKTVILTVPAALPRKDQRLDLDLARNPGNPHP